MKRTNDISKTIKDLKKVVEASKTFMELKDKDMLTEYIDKTPDNGLNNDPGFEDIILIVSNKRGVLKGNPSLARFFAEY